LKKTILIFGILIAAILSLFQLSKFAIISGNSSLEFTIASIAICFFCIGLYLNKKAAKKIGNASTTTIDSKKIETLGISKREYEVLCEIAKGYSNKEIAARLFISESTIKSHVSNLYVKLDVKRRTQAIQKAKTLKILASV